jgi:hypothetical protein
MLTNLSPPRSNHPDLVKDLWVVLIDFPPATLEADAGLSWGVGGLKLHGST